MARVRETVAVAVLCACAATLWAPPGAMGAGPPQIGASWVEKVFPTGATLFAEIDPNGHETHYYFEYVTEAAFLASEFDTAAKTKEGLASPGSVDEFSRLSAILTPETTYHYRPVATNTAGVTEGPEHVFTTQPFSEEFHLPDSRGLEMVSPVDKGGDAIAGPEDLFGGGDIQAAAVAPGDPAAPVFTYGAGTAFGEAKGAPPVNQYLARRSAAGWGGENISTPLDSGAYGDKPDGAPYRIFSDDLSRALLFGGLACRGGLEACSAPNPPLPGSGAPAGYMAYYLRDSATGAVSSLLSAADVGHSAVSPQGFEGTFAAANPGLSHVVLSSCAALSANASEVPDGPGRCDPGAQNLYEWSSGGLQAINLLPGGIVTAPGATIAAPIGAVSNDGTRVYWLGGGALYLREGTQTHQVDEAVGGGGSFQIATPDGSVAFFTKAGHLYRYVAAKAATDLTPAGGVKGVLGASVDGTFVYYQDATGLQLWHNGSTTEIAAGAEAAASSNYPPATGTARLTPDGLHLVFLSALELTGRDNLDANTKKPDTEVYIYGPPLGGGEAKLVCASCNLTGERPEGSSSVPGVLANGTTRAYKPRALSTNGARLFFESEDALISIDTNKSPDVYEWERDESGDCGRSPGCVSLISSGRESNSGTAFLDATADGSDVFFLTGESLVGSDPGSIDIYDARVGGGFSEGGTLIDCVGDACQPLPAPPDDPTPGTLVPNFGNARLRVLRPAAPRRTRKHRKGRHAKHGRTKPRQGKRR